jgi:formate dehydrogenase
MAKVLCVLYPDPINGFPPVYARDAVPVITAYPDGQTVPNPKAIDFKRARQWLRSSNME